MHSIVRRLFVSVSRSLSKECRELNEVMSSAAPRMNATRKAPARGNLERTVKLAFNEQNFNSQLSFYKTYFGVHLLYIS